MTALVWFHEDGLNPAHEMLTDHPESPRVYVFDVSYLQQWNISRHRVQFIYESLLEIPDIQIYKGELLSVLKQLLKQYEATALVTTETPNHIIKSWQQELQREVQLVTYATHYPVKDSSSPRRFSRYWRKHDREWLS